MNINDQTGFDQFYQAYLNELTLQGKSPKTVDMYSRYLCQAAVLHTHGRNLDYHPHVHAIVPTGSLHKRSSLWRH